jgi:hypothetical protein
MCFSATVSYSTAAVLVATGLYLVHLARPLATPYRMLALVPLFFGVQQGFEGRVWQVVDTDSAAAVTYAFGFLFFSHFLWLWWFPLCSYLLECGKSRKRLFLGFLLFGVFSATLLYFAMLFNPDWLTVSVQGHSIIYEIESGYRSTVTIPLSASALYALIILLPLLLSSHLHLRVFGVLVSLSMVLTTQFYDFALISVWCFFAAVLSLYLGYMILTLRQGNG